MVCIGQRFGRWIVEQVQGKHALALCDCGSRYRRRLDSIASGQSTQCRRCANIAVNAKRKRSAPDPYKAERQAWRSMKHRCANPHSSDYPYYGGRGICVCERWINSFADFLADVGPRPSPAHSIDRMNNDGNYEPGNVRWATKKQQMRNKRGLRLIEFRGETKLISEWAEKLGRSDTAIRYRLNRGLPIDAELSRGCKSRAAS